MSTHVSIVQRASSLVASMGLCFVLLGCERPSETPASEAGAEHGAESSAAATAQAPPPSAAPPSATNRVDIPAAVRRNLGITFAKVEYRNVAQTLRLPGRFELLPTARREYRAPVSGRVELLVDQYQKIEPGTPLYHVDAASWHDLHEQIVSSQAKVDSMPPLRDAHRRHEQSLSDKVVLWQERLKQLDELRAAGGGGAAQFTEARGMLNATQAELANVMEKDAELQAEQLQAEAALRSLQARRELLLRGSGCIDAPVASGPLRRLTICAVAPGVVESLGITQGGHADENGHIVTIVQPNQIRFRARAMQSDLGRIRDGLPARLSPPSGGSLSVQDTMIGSVQIGLTADADDRTVDVIVQPERLSNWARAGASAQLELTLAGGGSEELAIPLGAVLRDGATPIIFRRDPANPDKVIRLEADVGLSDGRWIVISSGVKEGDEIVTSGHYQLMLATSGSAVKGGHFHSDGTFHEGEH